MWENEVHLATVQTHFYLLQQLQTCPHHSKPHWTHLLLGATNRHDFTEFI
jgi:hypothetical protein